MLKAKDYKPGLKLAFAHLKYDGHYVTVHRQNRLMVHNRRGDEITNRIRHNKWFQTLRRTLPVDHIIAGEIYVAGGSSVDVPTYIANEGELQFAAFAAMNLPEAMPIDELTRYFTSQLLINTPVYLYIPDRCTCDQFLEMNPNLHQKLGGEGWVFKDGNRLNWHKWKPMKTCDCVIIGYTEGKGKYDGQIGSLVTGLYDNHDRIIPIADVSGFDDAFRRYCSESRLAMIGTVVEITYQFEYKDGGLRHPHFVRTRPDKLAKECTMEQITK